MRLRTRLVVAFLLLAVVPLAALTLFSYLSSERALRRAVEAEAGAAAEDMRQRIDVVASDLSRGLEKVGEMPASDELARAEGDDAAPERFRRLLESQIGAAARLIESLEFIPKATPPADPPSEGHPPAPPPRARARHGRIPAPPGGGAGPAAGPQAPSRRVIVMPPPPPVAVEGGPPPATASPGVPAPGVSEEVQRAIEETTSEARREGGVAWRDVAKEIMKVARAKMAEGEASHHVRLQLGRDFGFTLRRRGEAVGTVRAHVRSRDFVREVLDRAGGRADEYPFALDADGTLYAQDEDRPTLEPLGLADLVSRSGGKTLRVADWMIVTRADPSSGLVLGMARPVGGPLREIRRSAWMNLLAGLGLVGLALFGTLPLSRRMTRDLAVLTDGAERLARGDLDVQVPVRSADEMGRLAETFNRMAHDLRTHQEQLLAQERIRKELEMGRRIQEEMLPHDPLRVPFAEVKGLSIPAREVAGDFFNYFVVSETEAALLVGDVSGKGVGAALLMANLQATLRARMPLERDLSALAKNLDQEIEATTRQQQYLTAFIAVLDGRTGHMRYVNAGHNAPFVLRANGETEVLESTGRPLGLLPGGDYEERSVSLADGDSLFLYTDGVTDTEDERGEAFGVERLRDLILQERKSGLDGMLARVEEAVRTYRGTAEPQDDATLVVLRVGHGLGRAESARA